MLRLALLAVLAGPLSACLWDYDTLAQESRGMGDLKAVIVGGFARNPALYYEMRLERVTKLLAEKPDDLDAYDAAGVACDRLGRSDEAIEWMARKQAAMDRMGYDASKHAQPNHRYRYLANLGTFHAHRWFAQGANREAMADMLLGRDLIAQAIKENPDAHFGREKYQLRIMEWVIAQDWATGPEGYHGRAFDMLPLGRFKVLKIEHFDDKEVDAALAGMAGLIAQGNAWESVDVLNTIRALLSHNRMASYSYFAELRVRELVDSGKRSLTWPPDVTAEDALQRLKTYGVTTESSIRSEFKGLRQAADAWHESRTAFMLAALERGLHPDTHADFWEEFDGNPHLMPGVEVSALELGLSTAYSWLRQPRYLLIALSALLVVLLFVLYFRQPPEKRRGGVSFRRR